MSAAPETARVRAPAPADRVAALGLRTLQAGPLLILALLCVAMASLSPYFATRDNLVNLGFQASFVAVLALGQLLVIVTRGIDLSVGSVVGLAGVVAARAGHGGAATLTLFAASGLAVGLANGAVLVGGRVMNPFIVTLGTLGIARGLALVISGGETRTGLAPVVDTLGSGMAGIPAAHPRLDAVFSTSDSQSIGAVKALQAAHRDPLFVSFDAQPPVVKDIGDGTVVDASVAWSAHEIGADTVKAAVAAARGRPVDKRTLVPVTVVTQGNAASWKG